jgi:hypothetical protein
VLEDRLNQRQKAVTVKTFNFGASAYSVKQMVATLQYRTPDIQPDLIVMAIITSDFNLGRTPTIDAQGYLFVQNSFHFIPPDPRVGRALRRVHLVYVLREMALRWFYRSPDVGRMISQGEIPQTYKYIGQFKKIAEGHGIPYVVVLLPRTQSTWGEMSDRLMQDAVTYLDLSILLQEFTEEQFMASRFDSHPSAAVHHRIGESLAEYVLHQAGFAP